MLKTIARLESPFKEKFGIPRQPSLTSKVRARIIIEKEFSDPSYFKGLEEFSHIWLTFLFDNKENELPTVRPPRLGGKKRVGVFATRSPHRPNLIGMSVVRLEKIEFEKNTILTISSHDLLDQTRIIDIKPYVKKWDSLEEANNGWIKEYKDTKLEIQFDLKIIDSITTKLKQELIEILQNDPRPVHQSNPESFSTKVYSMKYDIYDIHWKMEDNFTIKVFQIDTITHGG